MSFATRLKEQRIRMGLTQVQLANAIGVSKGAVGNYEIGTSSPKAENLYQLFDILKCDANYLFQDEMRELHEAHATPDEMENLVKKYRLLDPPGKEAVDSILDIEHRRVLDDLKRKQEERITETADEISGDTVYFTVPEYSLPMSAGTGQLAGDEWAEDLRLIKAPPRGTSYVAHVKGNSMEPTYQDGDLLFIHSVTEIEPGQIGVFLLGGQQGVKELGDGVLISHNSEYDPIPFEEGIQCQGLVLGVCDESYFE